MSKISSAFGTPGGSKKPTKREIFEGLFRAKQAKDAAALLGSTAKTASKFDQARLKKAGRLKRGPGGSIEDDDDKIQRPGARKATLLGQ